MKKLIIAIIFLLCASTGYSQTVILSHSNPAVTIRTTKQYDNLNVIISSSAQDSVKVYGIFSEPYREVLLTGVNQEKRNISSSLSGGLTPQGYSLFTSGTSTFLIRYSTTDTTKTVIVSITGSGSSLFPFSSNLAKTDGSNAYILPQYFQRLIVDTLTVNHIDSVHSTYWFSNTGDTIGYIDAATEKVAFFKQMTIGNLSTNTTVAENFIRSNQVQTDTLIPHSPLILAGDTTIARKLFADSVMTRKVKAGNILINGVDNSISGANIVSANILSSNGRGYFYNLVVDGIDKSIKGVDTMYLGNAKIFNANGWIYTPSRIWADADFVNRHIFPWNNHTGSVGDLTHYYSNVYSDTINTSWIKTNTINTTNIFFTNLPNTYIEAGGVHAGNVAFYNSGTQYAHFGYGVFQFDKPIINYISTSNPDNKAGTIYFNSSDNHFYGYNGTTWQQLDN